MKKIRKSLYLMVIVSIVIVIAIVVKNENQKNDLPTLAYFSDGDYVPKCYEISIEEQAWFAEAENSKLTFQFDVNLLLDDLCQFMNEEYDANWDYEPILVYVSDVTNNIDSDILKYGACYYQGKIYIDLSLGNELEGQLRYIVAHELLHYLYDINTNNYVFALENNQAKGCYVGAYLNEAFIDALARKYMLKNDPDIEQDLLTSGYKYTRLLVDLMELSIPDLFMYFINNDIAGLQAEIDRCSREKLVCKDSPFIIWISFLDEIIVNRDTLDDSLSLLLTYTAYLTPKEKFEDFKNRGEEEGVDLTIFKNILSYSS